MIPAPKHVIVDRLEDGTITTRLFQDEQGSAPMLHILGYNATSNAPALEDPLPELRDEKTTKLASV